MFLVTSIIGLTSSLGTSKRYVYSYVYADVYACIKIRMLHVRMCACAVNDDMTQGKEAIKAHNVFFYLTYEGAVDLDAVTDDLEVCHPPYCRSWRGLLCMSSIRGL